MNKPLRIITILSISVLLFNCTPYFISHDFEIQTANHKAIAILPFEMNYTGRVLKEITKEDLKKIEEAESKAFMISYYNEILRSTKSGKKPIRVKVQNYKNTIKLLEANGINTVESWNIKAEKLADILQVDAVLRGNIEKNQLMPELESLGIEVGMHILNIMTKNALWPWIPYDLSKSKIVKTNYSIVD
ncbi:MAG: hypothetical protein MUP82_09805, partial [Candidatus Marinimicrobia bacterium]|nr:hypothetical protein [Candidatus Neomarinimicrobiota bacterium]